MINRPTPQKMQQSAQLASDVDAFLAAGNKAKQLPGFGMRPVFDESITRMPSPKSLPQAVYDAVDTALINGQSAESVVKEFGVSGNTVSRRREIVAARKLRELKERKI